MPWTSCQELGNVLITCEMLDCETLSAQHTSKTKFGCLWQLSQQKLDLLPLDWHFVGSEEVHVKARQIH